MLFREQVECQLDGETTPKLFPEQVWCRLDGGHTPDLFREQVEYQLDGGRTPHTRSICSGNNCTFKVEIIDIK